jgi:hypothetical protein
LSQLVFLTFFLGLVSGPQTVSLNASPDIRTVAILLDEQKVATLQPPFTGTIDLGGRLAPRQLVAVGYDDRGNEVARTAQILNVPHPPAEATIVLSDGNRRAEIRWMEKANETPAAVHLTVDGEAVPLDKAYTGTLPALSPASPHVIEAEIRFPSGAVARHDVTIAGGAYSGSVDSELTPVVVQGDARPEKLSQCFDARVSAVEKSRAFVVMVKDPDAGGAVRSLARTFQIPRWQERIVMNIDPLDRDTSGSILWPVMQERTRAGSPTMAVYDSSQDFDAKEFGMLWALTRGNRLLPKNAERRYADAVAVAGMLAAERGTRRAVVLLLEAGHSDASSRDAKSVRDYLRALGVSLHVWAIAATREQRQAWGEVSDVSDQWRLGDATKQLRADLASQSVVWVATDPWHALRAAAKPCH